MNISSSRKQHLSIVLQSGIHFTVGTKGNCIQELMKIDSGQCRMMDPICGAFSMLKLVKKLLENKYLSLMYICFGS